MSSFRWECGECEEPRDSSQMLSCLVCERKNSTGFYGYCCQSKHWEWHRERGDIAEDLQSDWEKVNHSQKLRESGYTTPEPPGNIYNIFIWTIHRLCPIKDWDVKLSGWDRPTIKSAHFELIFPQLIVKADRLYREYIIHNAGGEEVISKLVEGIRDSKKWNAVGKDDFYLCVGYMNRPTDGNTEEGTRNDSRTDILSLISKVSNAIGMNAHIIKMGDGTGTSDGDFKRQQKIVQKRVIQGKAPMNCAVCFQTIGECKLYRCSLCYYIYYCCKEHQYSDWSRHKDECGTRKKSVLSCDVCSQVRHVWYGFWTDRSRADVITSDKTEMTVNQLLKGHLCCKDCRKDNGVLKKKYTSKVYTIVDYYAEESYNADVVNPSGVFMVIPSSPRYMKQQTTRFPLSGTF